VLCQKRITLIFKYKVINFILLFQDSQLTPIVGAANGSSEILGSEDISATPDLQKAKHAIGRLGDKIMRIKDQITEEQNTRDGMFF